MTTTSITDPDDPRIAGYRHIRERDLRGRDGLYVAEGEVVLAKVLHNSRHRLESLLIAEKRIDTLADLLAKVPDDVPIYAASQPVLDAIAGFPLHRGILALARPPAPMSAEALLSALPEQAVVLALMGIANHDNLGGIFRNAAGFGVDAVILDDTCCDPLYRKAIRVSVGATLLVPYATLHRGEDMLTLLERHTFTTLSLSPAGNTPLSQVRRAPRTALLLGSEGPGLSAQVLARSQTVSIPMAAGFDSLNVATTSGIVLYQLTL